MNHPFSRKKAVAMVTALICASATFAEASDPVTGPASDISEDAAVLSGTFPAGAGFSSMAWGPQPDTYVANCGWLGEGTQSCRAANLTCGATYYYIATSVNKGRGAQRTFTTTACHSNVTKPVTGAATDITKTTATLSGVFPDGSSFSTLAWGTVSGSYTNNCGAVGTGAQSCTATNLTCGTPYYYIAATLRLGRGAQNTFTTASCD